MRKNVPKKRRKAQKSTKKAQKNTKKTQKFATPDYDIRGQAPALGVPEQAKLPRHQVMI